MKNIFTALIMLALISSCDDGNFEVPSFEFETTVNHCGEYVLYKLSTSKTETLILSLTASSIRNTVTTTPIEVNISAANVNYRTFSGALNASTYFCAAVPPTLPAVTRNWIALSGNQNKIIIETTAVLDAANTLVGYKHSIVLKNLVLESNGESITYETYDFGSFETAI